MTWVLGLQTKMRNFFTLTSISNYSHASTLCINQEICKLISKCTNYLTNWFMDRWTNGTCNSCIPDCPSNVWPVATTCGMQSCYAAREEAEKEKKKKQQRQKKQNWPQIHQIKFCFTAKLSNALQTSALSLSLSLSVGVRVRGTNCYRLVAAIPLRKRCWWQVVI